MSTVDVLDYNRFDKIVGENLEAQFWGGALVHAARFVYGDKWVLIVTALMEWEGASYYVSRVRSCPDAGGPSTDVVSTYTDAMNGYAFFEEWADLKTSTERFEISFLVSPWSPWRLEDVDLSSLQEEMMEKISSPTARLGTPCEWWE